MTDLDKDQQWWAVDLVRSILRRDETVSPEEAARQAQRVIEIIQGTR